MLKPLARFFKYSDTVIFETSDTLERAAARLAGLIGKRTVYTPLTIEPLESSLAGTVSNEVVRVHKVVPMYGNLFKPIFWGKFHAQKGKVLLVGCFEMGLIARVIVRAFVYVGFAVQIILLPLIGTESGLANLKLFSPTLFVAGGLLIVLLGRLAGKRDVAWIKHQVGTVFTASTPVGRHGAADDRS